MLGDWVSRHRNRANFWLHMVGIPPTVAAIPLAVLGCWLLAAVFLLGGYVLQILGHSIEGNRSGEERVLRRLISRLRRT